jgi:hypothetical protein
MNINPIQVAVFILAFVPGYIFVHTLDYHLLKGEKSQFEKTVQVLLASTIIWLIALLFPFLFPVENKKEMIIYLISDLIKYSRSKEIINSEIIDYSGDAIYVFIVICFYSFILSNVLAILRRCKIIDLIIRTVTRRDWFKTVSLRFYTEQLGSTLLVTMKSEKKYVGVLVGAPDDKNDNSIILSNPSSIESLKFVKLAAKKMLINVTETSKIEVLKEKVRRNLWQLKKKSQGVR